MIIYSIFISYLLGGRGPYLKLSSVICHRQRGKGTISLRFCICTLQFISLPSDSLPGSVASFLKGERY